MAVTSHGIAAAPTALPPPPAIPRPIVRIETAQTSRRTPPTVAGRRNMAQAASSRSWGHQWVLRRCAAVRAGRWPRPDGRVGGAHRGGTYSLPRRPRGWSKQGQRERRANTAAKYTTIN